MTATEALQRLNEGGQEPDARAGFYYVTCIRSDGASALLAGPYLDHASALARIGVARDAANEVDARAHWYAFGTARTETDLGPGKLNDLVLKRCKRGWHGPHNDFGSYSLPKGDAR